MFPTEKLAGGGSEIRGTPEVKSADFVVVVQRQAHRQLAAPAMQLEHDPLVGLADRTVELFDFAKMRSEVGEKFGCFLWWKRLGHLRIVEFLHGGTIASIEQIDNVSSNDGVAIGFFGANRLQGQLQEIIPGTPAVLAQSQPEHQKEPDPDERDFAVKSQLPEGDLEFRRLDVFGGGHGESDRAQIGGIRLVERLASFGRTKQRFELCLDGQKLFAPRPLVEPVNKHVDRKDHQRDEE